VSLLLLLACTAKGAGRFFLATTDRTHASQSKGSEVCFHRQFIYKGDTSTPAQGTDPRVALGAEGELP